MRHLDARHVTRLVTGTLCHLVIARTRGETVASPGAGHWDNGVWMGRSETAENLKIILSGADPYPDTGRFPLDSAWAPRN